MLDNFEQIKKHINPETDDQFYHLQLLKRKKDGDIGVMGMPKKSQKVVKTYYIKSLEHLNKVEDEIKGLCDVLGTRAQINLNRRSFKKCAFGAHKILGDSIFDEVYHKAPNAFNSACGQYSSESKTTKKWIIDVDEDEIDYVDTYIQYINEHCLPEGDKIVDRIPSRSGIHIITTPFNKKKFSEQFPGVEIQDDNPTNLYINF